jgi:hypothetical protein
MTVRTVWYILFFILWQFERCGIFCFHFIAVRTVWYILFFTLWQFERCGIFSFSIYNCSNGVVYLVFHFITFRTVWYILFFIWWHFGWCGLLKTKYTTPFELSWNEKQNTPHRSNRYKMKNKIYCTIRTVIEWKKNIPHRSNCYKMKNKI